MISAYLINISLHFLQVIFHTVALEVGKRDGREENESAPGV